MYLHLLLLLLVFTREVWDANGKHCNAKAAKQILDLNFFHFQRIVCHLITRLMILSYSLTLVDLLVWLMYHNCVNISIIKNADVNPIAIYRL